MPSFVQPSSSFVRRWYVYVLIALVCRGLFIGIQLHYRPSPMVPGYISIESGDTKGYLDPVENLLANGRFEPDYRMPGIAVPYWIFRQFLDVGSSRDALVILQWLLSGINVYVLGLLALRMSGSDRVAQVVYWAFLASAYSSWFDPVIASDSLSISVLIFQAFFLQSAIDRRSSRDLLISGVLLAGFIFMRPIGLLLIPLVAALLLHRMDRTTGWKWALVIATPFLLADTAWTIRNHRVHGTFSPLTNEGWFPADFSREIRAHAMHFVQGYGGNYIWWAPGKDIRWFGVWKGGAKVDDEGRNAKEPPAYAYVNGYTRKDLFALSQRVRSVGSGTLSTSDSLAETAAINADFDRYAAMYQEQAPFQYHVLSRFRMFKNLVWQHGTESMIIIPFRELPFWAKLFKLLQVAAYVLTFSIGAVACCVLLWRWRNAPTMLHLWLPLTTAYLVLIFPFALRMCEWRYMAHPYPFALLLAVLFLAQSAMVKRLADRIAGIIGRSR